MDFFDKKKKKTTEAIYQLEDQQQKKEWTIIYQKKQTVSIYECDNVLEDINAKKRKELINDEKTIR